MPNSETKVCAEKILNSKYVHITLKSLLNSKMNICSEGEVLHLSSPQLINSIPAILESNRSGETKILGYIWHLKS